MEAWVLSHPLLHCLFGMVSAQVFDHLKLVLGAVGTVPAKEGLQVAVCQIVVPEAGGPTKAFLTLTTNIGLFLTVFALVGLEQEACFKTLSALLTDIGASVAMLGVSVDTEGIPSVGTVFTLIARKRLVTCMFCHVVL